MGELTKLFFVCSQQFKSHILGYNIFEIFVRHDISLKGFFFIHLDWQQFQIFVSTYFLHSSPPKYVGGAFFLEGSLVKCEPKFLD